MTNTEIHYSMKVHDSKKQQLAENREVAKFVKRAKEYASADLNGSSRTSLILACRAFIKSYYG